MTEIIQYRPNGVCAQAMQVKIDGDTIESFDVIGGCHGNLQGIKSLIRGMKIDDVIERLEGIKCGSKSSSCPDQLAKCLIEYRASLVK